jgi:hypothetical protein
MAPKSIYELSISRIPEFGMIIEAGTSDQQSIGRECNMVDLLLVTEHPRHRFRSFRWLPQIHRKIVAGRYKSFDYFSVDPNSFQESFFRLCNFLFVCRGYFPRMIVEGGSVDEVCRQCEMIDPVSVRIQ